MVIGTDMCMRVYMYGHWYGHVYEGMFVQSLVRTCV
jgi:hypothetical protein